MKRFSSVMVSLSTLLGAAALTGCAQLPDSANLSLPPVGAPSADGAVVKAQAVLPVATGQALAGMNLRNWLLPSAFAASGNQNVSTTLAPFVSFHLDHSLFAVPASPAPFSMNDFGFLQINALRDNNLNVCGSDRATHCGTAMIRMYTTGAPGAGLWNAKDQYGAPIHSGQGATLGSVGLNASSALVMQQIAIPGNKHVVTLSDFTNPKFDVQADFSAAGAGAYSTTLVLEYALAP